MDSDNVFICCDPVYSVSFAEFLCSYLLNHQCFISTFYKAAKVSDAFAIPESNVAYTPALECIATMLNINAGHNQEILDNCKPLRDYSIFVSKVRSYEAKGLAPEAAVDCAIDECIQEDVLVNILTKHRTLAKNSILTEYDEKKRRYLDRLEGYEDGRNEGIEIGRNEGQNRGIQIFVLDHLEDGTPKNRIIEKLVFRFQLDPEEAKEYVEKYK